MRVPVLLATIAILLAAPYFIYPVLLMTALCFVVFACSFNLLLGYAGLLSFGHSMFFGGAGYLAGYMLKNLQLSLELATILGAVGAGLLGLAVGALAIRRQGIQFAMVTLAFSQLVYFFFLQAEFTGGENGLQSIPRNPLLGVFDLSSNFSLYYWILALTLLSVGLFYRIVHSPFGEVLRAIRDHEGRAQSLGFNPNRYRLLAFVLSASLAGLAGAMKASVVQFATLNDVSWHVSGEVILMVLLGGLGTLVGPMIGAVLIVFMNDHFAAFGEWSLVSQGVILMTVVVFFRRGVVGELNALRHRLAVRFGRV